MHVNQQLLSISGLILSMWVPVNVSPFIFTAFGGYCLLADIGGMFSGAGLSTSQVSTKLIFIDGTVTLGLDMVRDLAGHNFAPNHRTLQENPEFPPQYLLRTPY